VRTFASNRSRAAYAAVALASFLPVSADAQAAPEAGCLTAPLPARAASTPDPRSLALEDGRVLRVAGIESFALLHPDGVAADAALRARLRQLAEGSDLRIELLSAKKDRYGRLPAVVALADGRTLQEALLGEGLAIALTSGTTPCFTRFLAAEDEARRAERGFWAETALPKARPQALASRIGRFAIFEGRVVSVGIRRSATYLNFGERWSEDVSVEVRGRDRDLFNGGADLAGLEGRLVRVRGFLDERAGPRLVVRSPAQIEVLGKISETDGDRP
jgi:endonuclease YncB( thermonuclease family)